MGDGFQFVDIVLFALVAGFLILRLRAVLGRRDGHQSRTPDPFAQTRPERGEDKVVRLPDRAERPADAAASTEASTQAPEGPVAAGLMQVKVADPRFATEHFLAGARSAFELILSSFATGDSEALQPLLSPEVFANFAHSINARRAAQQRMETKLVAIKSAEIVEAYMAGRTAHITVKFVSEQISALYSSADAVIEGDPNTVTEITDSWTFARDTRSADPNWMLVATGSLE